MKIMKMYASNVLRENQNVHVKRKNAKTPKKNRNLDQIGSAACWCIEELHFLHSFIHQVIIASQVARTFSQCNFIQSRCKASVLIWIACHFWKRPKNSLFNFSFLFIFAFFHIRCTRNCRSSCNRHLKLVSAIWRKKKVYFLTPHNTSRENEKTELFYLFMNPNILQIIVIIISVQISTVHRTICFKILNVTWGKLKPKMHIEVV